MLCCKSLWGPMISLTTRSRALCVPLPSTTFKPKKPNNTWLWRASILSLVKHTGHWGLTLDYSSSELELTDMACRRGTDQTWSRRRPYGLLFTIEDHLKLQLIGWCIVSADSKKLAFSILSTLVDSPPPGGMRPRARIPAICNLPPIRQDYTHLTARWYPWSNTTRG